VLKYLPRALIDRANTTMDLWSRELLERVVAEVEEERATGDVRISV